MMADTAKALSWITAELAVRLAQVVESLTGENRPVQHAPATREEIAALRSAQTLWWKQPLEGIPNGFILTAAPEDAWLGVGKEILDAAGVAAQPGDAASTFTEALGQAFEALGQELSVKLRRDVTSGVGARPDADPSGEWHTFSIGDDKTILVRFSDSLLQAIERPGESALDASWTAVAVQQAARSKSLDLLYDVELPVSVSFGRAELPLKDVLKLTSGSIVELNRSVAEPVEIIVNNCVIARGEVVVIEGNYGVRVTQVISRQERLRTLR